MSAAERYKGHDQLIECWPAVRERLPDAQLVIAGRGDDAERLQRKAAELGLGDAVFFTGFVADATLEALLGAVAGFAMPSRGEGFGLVYLQAMRRLLPCIGCTVDAAADIILDGETGFLVDPDDRDALAARVVAVLADPDLRRRLGQAGLRRYEAEYTFDRFRARLGDILVRAFTPAARRSA
jgi:phosphatidylinositol alpha-1,6-mannosyltransferase